MPVWIVAIIILARPGADDYGPIFSHGEFLIVSAVLAIDALAEIMQSSARKTMWVIIAGFIALGLAIGATTWFIVLSIDDISPAATAKEALKSEELTFLIWGSIVVYVATLVDGFLCNFLAYETDK